MIDQLTVFLGNEKGRLTALCRTLGDAGIQMHALTLADTSDYGIVRIICDNPKAAMEALSAARFSASLAKVVAVEAPHVPGGLANVFATLDDADVNIEYSYCFIGANGVATVAIKAPETVMGPLEAAGFRVLHPADLYSA